ncbi:MAG: L-serine ammonia-lyase, iron-sulfur-dependent, subunit alpha [Firmicutes bacterium]|nr:L-serine ammonia-lyase, iron-sulfur-dependent, subunit alpha [Bacillota bacterium]
MVFFKSIAELLKIAEEKGKPLSDVVWMWECERSECSSQTIWDEMSSRLKVMKEAVETGLKNNAKSASGLIGGDARRLFNSHSLMGEVAGRAAAYALAISEVNAGMGKIVACPTAGSCGIVPGALLASADYLGCGENTLIRALFTAGGIGEVVDRTATVSGAVGGCQAECGTAAAMAAAAVVEMMGGSPKQSADAAALSLKNMLGLVCDPVAGLVEVPCVKRNAFAAVHALLATDMALAGVESVIPVDEVIQAMHKIGIEMPVSLKETSACGLATTPTANAIAERLISDNTAN